MKDADPAPAIEALALGLADRVRNLLLALNRQDRLETASVFAGWLAAQDDEALKAASEEMMLRALGRIADRLNHRLLGQLDVVDGTGINRLMAATGLDRVAASERINDLAQVGLVSRELTADEVRLTPLGVAALELVQSVGERCATHLLAQLQAAATGGGGRRRPG